MSGDIHLPGDDVEDRETATEGLATRLDSLDGKRIAYVDWGKPNGETLYEFLQDRFETEYGVSSFAYYSKPVPSSPIPGDTVDEIVADGADAVVFAIADCGSCNSSIVIDCLEFETELDLPTVQVITDKFLDLNSHIAEGRGYDALPTVVLDHPTRYLDADAVEAIADDIHANIDALLTGTDRLVVEA
jgi:hypothetical protein